MKRLEFLRRFSRGPVFDLWLADARGRGYMPGSALVERLGAPFEGQPGLPDNVYAADSFLAAAEEEGLIRRVSHDPSREMCFFGVGGMRVKRGRPSAHSRPCEFGWAAQEEVGLPSR